MNAMNAKNPKPAQASKPPPAASGSRAEQLAARKRQYVMAVKTKQRQLGMDDATYRALLLARTGKTSATDCTLTQLALVADYLSSQGAVAPGRKAQRSSSVSAARLALRGKVDALLTELTPLLGLKDPQAYAGGICQRNGWCSHLAFADEHILHKLVGALSTTLRRLQQHPH